MGSKIFYGTAEAGVNAVEIFLRLHLLVFYTSYQQLSPFAVGSVLALSIFWDAITDPLVGRFSDRFKDSHGTRLPLVLAGAISTAFCIALLYQPPEILSTSAQKLIYLLVMSLALNTCYTFFAIPYSAMVGDYTDDRHERSQFIAWRLVFANLGALLGIGVPGYFLAKEAEAPYAQASWIIAMVVVTSALLSTLKPPPRKLMTIAKSNASPSPLRISGQLKSILQNRPFLWILSAYFILNVGLAINSSSALYFYRLRLLLSEQEIQNVLILFLLIFSASVPTWLFLGRKWGRKKVLILGALGLGISNMIIYPYLPQGNAEMAYLWASIFGGFWVGSSVLLEATLTDVIDYDQTKSKSPRFGLYFGVWKFAGKSSRAIALLFTGSLLEWVGISFPDDLTGPRLAFLFGPGVGFFFVVAAALAFPYALDERRMEKIKRILKSQTGRI